MKDVLEIKLDDNVYRDFANKLIEKKGQIKLDTFSIIVEKVFVTKRDLVTNELSLKVVHSSNIECTTFNTNKLLECLIHKRQYW